MHRCMGNINSNNLIWQIIGDYGRIKCKQENGRWKNFELCAMSIWKQQGEVTEKEYEVIIAGIDRMLAHSSKIAAEFMSLLEEEDSIAKILLLLLC